MFNIGGGEFLAIALIALIVLGPTRLPDAARQVGKAMGELRRMSNGFQAELRDAFTDAEAAAPTAPRRDVLAAPPEPTAPAADAIAAVSKQAPARRTPLRAAPLPNAAGAAPTPTASTEVAAQHATAARATAGPAKKATVTAKPAGPRSKGS